MTRIPLYTIMLGTGQHNAWKLVTPGQRYLESFNHYLRVAQESERAGLHGLLLADGLSLDQARQVPRGFEPLTLLAVIAARTTRIGLIPTLSTTFNEPYNVARTINSLDNLSAGRIGVNLATSFTRRRTSAAPFLAPAICMRAPTSSWMSSASSGPVRIATQSSRTPRQGGTTGPGLSHPSTTWANTSRLRGR
jgi:luciferase-like monooxygenase